MDHSSPPPLDNFGGRYPRVYRGPYEYSVPGAPQDFLLQDVPDEQYAAGQEPPHAE